MGGLVNPPPLLEMPVEHYISETARKAVKRYNKHYDIVPVENSLENVEEPLMIAKQIRSLQEVIPGVFTVTREWFPQLYIEEATCADNRWIAALEGAKIAKVKELILADSIAAQHARNMADAEAMAEEEADYLYYLFRKKYNGTNWSSIKSNDPMEWTKRTQDRLGRELR